MGPQRTTLHVENSPELSFGNKVRQYGSLLLTTGALGLAAVGAGCGAGEQTEDPGKPVGSGDSTEMPGGKTMNKNPAETQAPTPTDQDEDTPGDRGTYSGTEAGDYETPPHSVIATGTGGDKEDLLKDPSDEYLKLGENVDLEGLEQKCQDLIGERSGAILPFLEASGELAVYHCFLPGSIDLSHMKK